MNATLRHLCGVLFFLAAAAAQTRAVSVDPETWKLTVHAQAVARPALQYSLLTDLSDRTAGNAAPMYLLAISQANGGGITNLPKDHPARKDLGPDEQPDLVEYYLNEVPFEKLAASGDEVDTLLRSFSSTFQAFDVAARREYCRWDLPVRELGFETLLPHLNGSRDVARIAGLRARLHMARGEFPQAAKALRGVYQLGRDVADDGLLIQALVGAGIASLGNERLKEFVQQPKAPNLYWALAGLPRPFGDWREALEWERVSMLATFPQLKKAETDEFTAADWQDLFNRMNRYVQITSDDRARAASAAASLGPAAAGAVMYPAAKRYLVERGMPVEQVAALPVPQVLGRYLVGEYRSASEEMLKWAGLPFWQAVPGMQRAEEEFQRVSQTSPAKWLLTAVPTVARSGASLAKFDRQVAALQTVEALRAYAAAHDAKLPASLAELSDTPAPPDPTTGKPFGYKLEGDRATLESPAPLGDSPRGALRVQVTIVK